MNVPTHPDRRKRIALGLGGAALLALGAAGGAGAIAMTRPHAEMAPTVPTMIARLGDARGVVTVRGRVAEVYGSRFVVQDATGRALVDTGRGGPSLRPGSPILVQGRFGDGELRARYLVDASGTVAEVGPPPPPPHGAGGPPPPPPPGAVPPPPPGGPAAPPPPVAMARPVGGQMRAVSAGEAAAPPTVQR